MPSGISLSRSRLTQSVLSLAGLYSLVEGDGTNFSLGHAHLEIFPDRQIIHQARATGTALAVDLVGVIDPVERDMEVSGTMLPLYGLNKLVGGVPIIGEILTGVDLTRRVDTQEVFGLTSPLITTASGAKMGKSAQGAIWLNKEKLPVWDFWQYWRNTEDADVGRFLKLFTELPLDEIARLEALQGSDINEAKIILANAVTTLCHSAEDAAEAAAVGLVCDAN